MEKYWVGMHRHPAYTLSTHHSLSATNVSLMGWHIFISDFLSRNAHSKMMPSRLKHQQSPWPNVGSLHLDLSMMCQAFPHACKVQALGSTWDLPSKLQTCCYCCPCAQEITGHSRSNQNAARCTETPGKLLLSTMPTLKNTNGVLSKRLPLQTPMSKSVWFCCCFMCFYNCSFWRLLQGLSTFLFKTFF